MAKTKRQRPTSTSVVVGKGERERQGIVFLASGWVARCRYAGSTLPISALAIGGGAGNEITAAEANRLAGKHLPLARVEILEVRYV